MISLLTEQKARWTHGVLTQTPAREPLRKGLESPVSMAHKSKMEHIQNRVLFFGFVLFFSSEYFSFTFFSHVPCDYQNLFFGLNAFWNFITWLHSKLYELKKESNRVCETWITQDHCHLLYQRQFSASFWIISLYCSLCQSLDQRNIFQSISATWSVNWIQNCI